MFHLKRRESLDAVMRDLEWPHKEIADASIGRKKTKSKKASRHITAGDDKKLHKHFIAPQRVFLY